MDTVEQIGHRWDYFPRTLQTAVFKVESVNFDHDKPKKLYLTKKYQLYSTFILRLSQSACDAVYKKCLAVKLNLKHVAVNTYAHTLSRGGHQLSHGLATPLYPP